MEITCPNCGQTCEAAEEPSPGQHLRCPFCDVKFNYTPQNTTENDSNSIANTAEPNAEASPAKIQAICPHCGATYEVDAAYIGETATCGTCNKAFVVKAKHGHTAAASSKESPVMLFAKAKAVVNTVKVKAIALWQSGMNGKFIIFGIAVLLAFCLAVPFLLPNRNADTAYEIGLRYLNGDGVAKDMVMAADLFRKAARNGNVEAQFKLGLIHGSLQDWHEAAKWYHMAAEQGHPKAKMGLGFCYLFGLGVPKDEAKANLLLNEAKQDPSLQGQIQEFMCLFHRSDSNLSCANINDAEKDKPKDVESVRQAAEQGNVEAEAAIGLCYFHGEGVEKDEEEAMKWFRKAAEKGHAESQCLLGLGYESGTGVSMDKREAVKWLVKAGEQGEVKAQTELASLYLLGRGVEKDYKQSMKWCRMAAEQGDADAQCLLGGFFLNGLGVHVDKEEAIKWYSKAAEQGHDTAKKALNQLDLSLQRDAEKPTREFSGIVAGIKDDGTILVRDFTKGGVLFGIERKVRLAGIKMTRREIDFVRNRYAGCDEVRVTYKETDFDGAVRGEIWDGAYNGKRSLNYVLLEKFGGK